MEFFKRIRQAISDNHLSELIGVVAQQKDAGSCLDEHLSKSDIKLDDKNVKVDMKN